jgi:hypothetical protein
MYAHLDLVWTLEFYVFRPEVITQRLNDGLQVLIWDNSQRDLSFDTPRYNGGVYKGIASVASHFGSQGR